MALLPAITIRNLRHSECDGTHRVAADIDGIEVYFESSDVPLTPSPEAFAGPMLLAAQANGLSIDVDAPVCDIWGTRIPQIADWLHRVYGYSVQVPDMKHSKKFHHTPAKVGGTGLCFTGGVDSFHSLFVGEHVVDSLIYVLDFDVTPKHPNRMPQFEPWLRRLAADTGLEAIVIRTNLKAHLARHAVPWLNSHGAALAAVGHVLTGHIDRLMIASSYSYATPNICGSHWDLDPLWSSRRLQIVHSRPDRSRAEKLRDIAGSTLAHEYLRPCWENRSDRLNCCECEKCIRTQLALLACGGLDRFSVFRHETPLLNRLRSVRKIPNPYVFAEYEAMLDAGFDPPFQSAICRLLRRSRWSAWRRSVTQSLRLAFFGNAKAA